MTHRHHRTPRRTMVGLVAVVALVAGLPVAVAAPAAADAGSFSRPFAPVYNEVTNGDIVSRGNTVMTCESGTIGWKASGTGPACTDVQAGTAAGQNNYFNMVYIDVDGSGDPNTFNSSSATVTIPEDATVVYAGLT